MATNRKTAVDLLEKLTLDHDYTHEEILNYLINNYLSGDDALEGLNGFAKQYDIFTDPEEYEEEE